MTPPDFIKLLIWQRGMELTKNIYEITKHAPKEETYGLTSQIRRAAVSIPCNIAEGSQRNSKKDFAHFISIAKGSLAELETQILLAEKLSYADREKVENLLQEIHEISRMLYSFHSQLITHTS